MAGHGNACRLVGSSRPAGPGPVRGTEARTFAEGRERDPDSFCSRSVVLSTLSLTHTHTQNGRERERERDERSST
jgi:hypothetical protein